jgi:linoleoyl-CoA desaturase
LVFQVAHCVEAAAFPLPSAGTGRIERAWAIHQAETTVGFARPSRVAAWLLGGLNFQITEHRSFRDGVTAHFRWFRRMG